MPATEEDIATGTRMARVFFAIWPDNNAQKQLGSLVNRLRLESLCSGRKTKAENIHLTLVFVGEVDSHKMEALCKMADEIRESGVRAFEFAIEELRYWKHNHIVYLAPRDIPPELIDLVDGLRNGLSTGGFPLEQRDYAPHLTLIRDAYCRVLPELAERISWRVSEWVLIQSEQANGGSIYSPIGRWPLS